MVPDGRLVDRQVEVAPQLCHDSIDYLERELGISTLRPPGGKALIRRLNELKRQLDQLEALLAAISP